MVAMSLGIVICCYDILYVVTFVVLYTCDEEQSVMHSEITNLILGNATIPV